MNFIQAHSSVLKLEALATSSVNQTTTIRSPLSLVLLLREAFALRNNQFGVSTVGVIVRNVGVAGKVRIDYGIRLDALESVLNVASLRLNCALTRR